MSQPGAISVVVAVYNGEETLGRCLTSLSNQRGIDIEIVIVDDGSTDRTGEIASEFSQQNSNTVFLQLTSNVGQRTAQYHGVSAANGDFISAVDADDWVSADRFQRLYQLALDSPIVMSNMTRVLADGSHVLRKNAPTEGTVNYCGFDGIFGEPTDKLIRKDLLTEGFERYRAFFGDDQWHISGNMPVFWAMYHVGQIYHTADATYFYLDRPGSFSKTWDRQRGQREIQNVLRRWDFLSTEFPEFRSTIARKFHNFLVNGVWHNRILQHLQPNEQKLLESHYRTVRKTLEDAMTVF